MTTRLEKCSKSLPPVEFQQCINAAEDSGIESDTSPVSSTKLTISLEDLNDETTTQQQQVDPRTFLLGKEASESDRIDGITNAINWLRHELLEMKETDKQLTRTFITMRSQITEQRRYFESASSSETNTTTDAGYYDTNSIDKNNSSKTSYQNPTAVKKKERWNLISTDGAFPTNGIDFENNKRATWII